MANPTRGFFLARRQLIVPGTLVPPPGDYDGKRRNMNHCSCGCMDMNCGDTDAYGLPPGTPPPYLNFTGYCGSVCPEAGTRTGVLVREDLVQHNFHPSYKSPYSCWSCAGPTLPFTGSTPPGMAGWLALQHDPVNTPPTPACTCRYRSLPSADPSVAIGTLDVVAGAPSPNCIHAASQRGATLQACTWGGYWGANEDVACSNPSGCLTPLGATCPCFYTLDCTNPNHLRGCKPKRWGGTTTDDYGNFYLYLTNSFTAIWGDYMEITCP